MNLVGHRRPKLSHVSSPSILRQGVLKQARSSPVSTTTAAP
jgi:hypothetical protein